VLLRAIGASDTVEVFMCKNPESFAVVYFDGFLAKESSCHAAVLHEIMCVGLLLRFKKLWEANLKYDSSRGLLLHFCFVRVCIANTE